MKKIYTLAFSMVLLMVGSLSANAQKVFSGELTEEFRRSYDNSPVNFSLTEVASYFETDTTTFARALENFMESDPATFMVDDNSDKALYFTTTAGDPVATYPNATQSYSADFNGFWMTEAGVPVTYGAEGFAWFAFPDIDCPNDVFAFRIGQRPSYFTEGASLKLSYDLHYNGKVATFNVDVTIEPQPVVDVETHLSQLTIVKDYEFPLEFTIGKSYEGKAYSTTLDGLYDALGTTAEELDGNIQEVTFAQVLNEENVNDIIVYSWSDELKQPYVHNDGCWFGRYAQYDESTGEETRIEMNAPKAWGESADNQNTFYLQNITLANGEFTIGSVGQHPGVLKEGDSDYAYLYIINGDKAARIKVYTVMKEPQQINPDDFVMVGEATVEVTHEINDAYGTKSFNIDMAPILEALGVETYEEDFFTWASEGVMSDNHTEGAKNFGSGYYYNDAGFICDWGSSAAFFIAPVNGTASIQDGTYKIGQMAGHFTNITEATTVSADLIFKIAEKYYVVHVIYTVTPPEDVTDNPDDNFEIVSKQNLYKELVPSELYYGESDAETKANMEMELDMEAVKKFIGEGSYEFWGLKAPANADSYGTLTTSTGYGTNAGFTGGFWMGMPKDNLGEEYVNYSWVEGWAQNAYGIEWNLSTGKIGFDIHPNSPAHQVGDTYQSIFYLENTSNHKAIKYTLTVEYVSEYSGKGEEVGSTDVVGVLSADDVNGDGFYNVGETMSDEVYAALGIDSSNYGDCTWMITNASGKLVAFSGGLQAENATFDANGYYVDTSNEDLIDDVVFTLAFDEETNRFAIGFFGQEDPDNPEAYMAGKVFQTTVALRYGEKYYKFNIFAGDEQTVTGIKTISGDSVSVGKIYDISGREVANPSRGLYIINGKKVMIK